MFAMDAKLAKSAGSVKQLLAQRQPSEHWLAPGALAAFESRHLPDPA
jgi:hypothetical protein